MRLWQLNKFYQVNRDFTVQRPLNVSDLRKVLHISLGDKCAGDFWGGSQPAVIATCSDSCGHLSKSLFDIKTPLLVPTLTAALEERKSKQMRPMTHESSHRNWDFHVAVLDHPTTSVSLLCAPINIMLCTTLLHTEEDSWHSRSQKQMHKYFCFF